MHDDRVLTAADFVNERVLDMLANIMPEAEFSDLVRTGMASFEAYCRNMGAPQATEDAIQHDAHRLKGSSGSLGFARISDIAMRLEFAQRHEVAALVAELELAIARTARELGRLGLLAAPRDEPHYWSRTSATSPLSAAR